MRNHYKASEAGAAGAALPGLPRAASFPLAEPWEGDTCSLHPWRPTGSAPLSLEVPLTVSPGIVLAQGSLPAVPDQGFTVLRRKRENVKKQIR